MDDQINPVTGGEQLMKIYKLMYLLSFLLIFISDACFYDMNTLNLFIMLCGAGIMIGIGTYVCRNGVKLDRCLIWLLSIYLMFTIYGVFFLRAVDYNWDIRLFTLGENIAIYLVLKELFLDSDDIKRLIKAVGISAIIILFYLTVMEREALISGDVRIGNTLSGNVNTACISLGIMLIMLSFGYIKTKAKLLLIIYASAGGLCLLTGSKMAPILIVLSLFLYFISVKSKVNKWFFAGVAICITFYLIFYNSTLYSIIGSRIQDMIYQMFGVGEGHYSRSTADRIGMIRDGVKIFLTSPIYGGGEKYFAFRSTEYGHYGYSHCNYIEMLCNFGIIGTCLFYVPILNNFRRLFRARRHIDENGLIKFGLVMLLTHFILALTTVTYGETMISYLPILISFAIIEDYDLLPSFVVRIRSG